MKTVALFSAILVFATVVNLASAIKCYKCGFKYAEMECPGKHKDKWPIVDHCSGKCSRFETEGTQKITVRDCDNINTVEDGCKMTNMTENGETVQGDLCYCATDFCNGNSSASVALSAGFISLAFVFLAALVKVSNICLENVNQENFI